MDFDPKYHIQIETDALWYVISEVLSQMTFDQHFSNYVTYKKDHNSSKAKIDQ